MIGGGLRRGVTGADADAFRRVAAIFTVPTQHAVTLESHPVRGRQEPSRKQQNENEAL